MSFSKSFLALIEAISRKHEFKSSIKRFALNIALAQPAYLQFLSV